MICLHVSGLPPIDHRLIRGKLHIEEAKNLSKKVTQIIKQKRLILVRSSRIGIVNLPVEGIAATWLGSSVVLANNGDKTLVQLSLVERTSIHHHPGSILVRGAEGVGSHSDLVHVGVSVRRGALSRVRARASVDDVPVNAIIFSAVLSHGEGTSIAGGLQA